MIGKMHINSGELKALLGSFSATLTMTAQSAYAQAMPWETPLQKLLQSLSGPTARAIIVGAIVIAGLALCIGEAGSFFRKAMAAVFGGAVAIGAASWAPTLFGNW
jgi:type IV secretory pathway VirB2 component (pilin)